MPTVNDILGELYRIAPGQYARENDNIGLLCGNGSQNVDTVMVALDITSQVIEEAAEIGAQLIIAHHPMFFELKCINDSSVEGTLAIKLINAGMSAICMHTNLDAAPGGINDILAKRIGLTDPLQGCEAGLLMRIGCLKQPQPMSLFAENVKAALGCIGLRYLDSGKPVSRVAVSSGSGGSMLDAVIKEECDTFVTGDVKYHLYLKCRELGVNIIDATHFATETIVVESITNKLKEMFVEIGVCASRQHRDFTIVI